MSKTERHSHDLIYQHTSTCTHAYIDKDMHPHSGFPWTCVPLFNSVPKAGVDGRASADEGELTGATTENQLQKKPVCFVFGAIVAKPSATGNKQFLTPHPAHLHVNSDYRAQVV